MPRESVAVVGIKKEPGATVADDFGDTFEVDGQDRFLTGHFVFEVSHMWRWLASSPMRMTKPMSVESRCY